MAEQQSPRSIPLPSWLARQSSSWGFLRQRELSRMSWRASTVATPPSPGIPGRDPNTRPTPTMSTQTDTTPVGESRFASACTSGTTTGAGRVRDPTPHHLHSVIMANRTGPGKRFPGVDFSPFPDDHTAPSPVRRETPSACAGHSSRPVPRRSPNSTRESSHGRQGSCGGDWQHWPG
jgi:hypothetical protein